MSDGDLEDGVPLWHYIFLGVYGAMIQIYLCCYQFYLIRYYHYLQEAR